MHVLIWSLWLLHECCHFYHSYLFTRMCNIPGELSMRSMAWACDSVPQGCWLIDTSSSDSRSPALHALLRLRTCQRKIKRRQNFKHLQSPKVGLWWVKLRACHIYMLTINWNGMCTLLCCVWVWYFIISFGFCKCRVKYTWQMLLFCLGS